MSSQDHRRRDRTTRSDGFSLLEITISLGILGFGLLTLSAMQVQALTLGASGKDYRQAVSIARDQMERVQTLPYAQVAPTVGLVTLPWINVAGYAAGDLPVTVDLPGAIDGSVEQVFSLAWRVTDANAAGTLRNVDVQVSWVDHSDRQRSYALSTVRSL